MRTRSTLPANARGANPELAKAMLGKAGNLTHGDRRTKRVRTRSARRRVAIADARE